MPPNLPARPLARYNIHHWGAGATGVVGGPRGVPALLECRATAHTSARVLTTARPPPPHPPIPPSDFFLWQVGRRRLGQAGGWAHCAGWRVPVGGGPRGVPGGAGMGGARCGVAPPAPSDAPLGPPARARFTAGRGRFSGWRDWGGWLPPVFSGLGLHRGPVSPRPAGWASQICTGVWHLETSVATFLVVFSGIGWGGGSLPHWTGNWGDRGVSHGEYGHRVGRAGDSPRR
jgi:hypothetical protein